MHLGLLAPEGATDRDPVGAAGGYGLSGLPAQVMLDPSLNDAIHRLVLGPVLFVPTKATVEPSMGAGRRALGVLARDMKRRALVEGERDVGPQRGLHRHRSLRPEEPLTAVDIGAEPHAVLVDRQDPALLFSPPPSALDLVSHRAVAHREHLKAAGVGDDRPGPAHQLVQTPQLLHQLGPRRQHQVERIGQYQLVAEARHLLRV